MIFFPSIVLAQLFNYKIFLNQIEKQTLDPSNCTNKRSERTLYSEWKACRISILLSIIFISILFIYIASRKVVIIFRLFSSINVYISYYILQIYVNKITFLCQFNLIFRLIRDEKKCERNNTFSNFFSALAFLFNRKKTFFFRFSIYFIMHLFFFHRNIREKLYLFFFNVSLIIYIRKKRKKNRLDCQLTADRLMHDDG